MVVVVVMTVVVVRVGARFVVVPYLRAAPRTPAAPPQPSRKRGREGGRASLVHGVHGALGAALAVEPILDALLPWMLALLRASLSSIHMFLLLLQPISPPSATYSHSFRRFSSTLCTQPSNPHDHARAPTPTCLATL